MLIHKVRYLPPSQIEAFQLGDGMYSNEKSWPAWMKDNKVFWAWYYVPDDKPWSLEFVNAKGFSPSPLAIAKAGDWILWDGKILKVLSPEEFKECYIVEETPNGI